MKLFHVQANGLVLTLDYDPALSWAVPSARGVWFADQEAAVNKQRHALEVDVYLAEQKLRQAQQTLQQFNDKIRQHAPESAAPAVPVDVPWEGTRVVRCAVAGFTGGVPDIVRVDVTCTYHDYERGAHYDMAKEVVALTGSLVAFDEFDGPDYLFTPERRARFTAS